MCLAVPVKIVSLDGSHATVDAGGNILPVDLSLVTDAAIGDYVLIHAGFAIQKYDPEDAEETLRLLGEMLDAQSEGGA